MHPQHGGCCIKDADETPLFFTTKRNAQKARRGYKPFLVSIEFGDNFDTDVRRSIDKELDVVCQNAADEIKTILLNSGVRACFPLLSEVANIPPVSVRERMALFRPKQSLWAVVCKSTEEICGENGRPLLFRTEKQASGFRRSLKTPRRVAVSRVTFGIVFTEPEPSELLVELTPRYRAQAIRRFWNYVCLNGLAPAGLVSSSEGADPLLYLRLR